ncbi:MAG: tetratricopeptide repeat protein [Vicinamibacterales bacterium]
MKRAIAVVALTGLVLALAAYAERRQRDSLYHRLLSVGEQALAAGDSFGAIEAFSGALTLRPDSMVAHYRKGEAYHAQHRDEEAVRDLLEAVRLQPDAPQPLVALAEIYDQRGEPARAAKYYEDADRLKGDDPALLYALALARYRAGNPAAAVEPLARAVARNDSLAEAHYLLGLVRRDTGDVEQAAASLETAVRLAPSLVPAREELADLYRSIGRTADEMAQLQALNTVDPSLDRRIAIALAQARNGQDDLALAAIAELRRTRPDDSRLLLARGRIELARAERSDLRRTSARAALTALERALGGTARRSEGLALYGRALDLDGQTTEAERILREAVATSPVEPQAFAYLADAAERLGHPLDARNALLDLDAFRGGTSSPDERAARAARIGALSLVVRDYRTAADYLARAVDRRAGDVRSLEQLARARWALGDRNGALEALDTARRLAPRDAALERLSRTFRSGGSADPGDPAARLPRS